MIDGYTLTDDGHVIRNSDGAVLAVLGELPKADQEAEAERVALADQHAADQA